MSLYLHAVTYLVTIGLSAGLGSLVLKIALKRIKSGKGPTKQDPLENDNGEATEVSTGVLSGGTWIGILERIAITGTIMVGFPEGIAVVIAIKGLGRYAELSGAPSAKRSEATEKFIIGTLASYVWAGLLGALGVWALSFWA